MSITEAIVIIAALIYTGFVFYILNKRGENMGRSIYLTEKEILALIDTSGEWIQMMEDGDALACQEVDNRLNEGLGRALKKLYRGRNGERIYKDY